jgi:hypothetical protein
LTEMAEAKHPEYRALRDVIIVFPKDSPRIQ